jgi:Tfp pilus assembly protein PilF
MWLALSQMAAGTIGEAMETIEQALQTSPKEFVLVPLMLMVRGQLRMKEGHSDLAETDFREALVGACSMGAKMLELYVIMSLARLLAQQQRRDEARAMLTEIYAWFTEGFDTADLKEAKALLEELAP